MAIRKIVKIGDDCLRQECRKQEKFDLRLKILLKDMADTMYKADGVGWRRRRSGCCAAWW